MIKHKPLLASLRERKRYLVYHVDSTESVEKKETQAAIQDACQTLLGTYGMAKAGLMFLEDWKDQKGILRVNRKYVDYIMSAFLFIRTIAGNQVTLSSVLVSGVLAKARGNL